ncbi:hypothetical protein B0H10DRAFT_2193755 [Mycena sp. CBHHK59/15]|nr:hypothetical protein B0H10DRAFT_2193755 [Mycena sp. CBHHK59/15]
MDSIICKLTPVNDSLKRDGGEGSFEQDSIHKTKSTPRVACKRITVELTESFRDSTQISISCTNYFNQLLLQLAETLDLGDITPVALDPQGLDPVRHKFHRPVQGQCQANPLGVAHLAGLVHQEKPPQFISDNFCQIILPSYNSTTSAEILDNLSIIWPVNCFEGILECRIQPSQSWLATETRKYDKSFKLRRSNDDPVTQQSPSSPSPVPCPLSPQGSRRAPGAALELDAQCPSVPSLACSGLASTIHFLNSSQVATSPSIPVAKPPRSIQSPVLLAQSHHSRLPTPPLRPIIKVTVKHRLLRAAASEDVLLLDG